MKLKRRDVCAEQTGFPAAAADGLELLDGSRVQETDELRLLHVCTPVDVLDHDDADEVGMPTVMVKRELSEPRERFDRWKMIELQVLFTGTNLSIRLLQHPSV